MIIQFLVAPQIYWHNQGEKVKWTSIKDIQSIGFDPGGAFKAASVRIDNERIDIGAALEKGKVAEAVANVNKLLLRTRAWDDSPFAERKDTAD